MVHLMDFELDTETEFKSRMQATLIHQNAKALYVIGGNQADTQMLKINLTESKVKILTHSECTERREPIALKMSAM